MFFRVSGGSVAEKSWLMRATVLGVVALAWNHVLRHFVHWNPCIKAMCSTVARCKSIVLWNSAVEWLRPRLLEWYLFFSIESCDSDCDLQVPILKFVNRILVVA